MRKKVVINSIKVKNLCKSYKTNSLKKEVFKNFNITFEKGKVHCILGVSGCGKSTLLRIIAGIEEFNSGEIIFDKTSQEQKMFLTMVLQENNLYPWFTVYENVKLAISSLENNSLEEGEIDKLLEKYKLLEYKKFYPYQLSVGLKQKVSLLKALIVKPKIILLDEAFCALDFLSKEAIHNIFLREHSQEKFTSILSTHDLDEACKLGDYIHLLTKDNKYKVFENILKKPRENDKKYQEFLEFIKKEYV